MELDERLIERYVREPEQLTETERGDAEELIRTDPGAQALADTLEVFFERLSREPSPRVRAFVDALFPSRHVVPLRPFQRYDKAHGMPVRQRYVAAQTPRERRGFVSLATFASESDDVLVRLLRKLPTQTCWVVVVTERREDRASAIVSLPDLDLDLCTDSTGQMMMELSDDEVDADWSNMVALLRRPVVTYAFDAGELARDEPAHRQLQTGAVLQCHLQGEQLRIAVWQQEAQEDRFSFAVVESGDMEQHVLVSIHHGRGVAKGIGLTKNQQLRVRLYY